MQNKFKGLLLIIFTFAMFSINNVIAYANHDISLKTYTYESFSRNLATMAAGTQIETVGDLVPGQKFKLGIWIKTETPSATSGQFTIDFDNTLVAPLDANGNIVAANGDIGFEYGPTWFYPNGILPSMMPTAMPPADIMVSSGWSTPTANNYLNKQVRMTIMPTGQQGEATNQLKGEGLLGMLNFIVLDTATPGATANFTFVTTDLQSSLYGGTGGTQNIPSDFTNLSKGIYSNKPINDASLKSLVVKDGSNELNLTPAFVPSAITPNTFDLVVPNSVQTIKIEAEVNDEFSSFPDGADGFKNLAVGDNNYVIEVTAQDQATKQEYTINVRRLSNDTTLSSMTLSGISSDDVTYNSLTKTYSVTVPYTTSSTDVSAIATEDPLAKVVAGLGTWNLDKTGSSNPNVKTITVEAENCLPEYASVPGNACTSTNYEVHVYRTIPSNNALLSEITVNGAEVRNFNPATTTYTLDDVYSDVTSIEVGATLQDDKGQIITTLGTKNLNIGLNEIEIETLAEDGITSKTYTVKIYVLNNDAKLNTLNVTSSPQGTFDPNFNPANQADYYVYTIPAGASSINIEAIANDAKAEVTGDTGDIPITGNIDLTVNVTAEDGITTNSYIIKVRKELSGNNKLSSLTVSPNDLNEQPFNPEEEDYTVTIPYNQTSVTIAAEREVDSSEILEGLGTHSNLKVGPNPVIKVVVKAENGVKKTYRVVVTRLANDDATLKSLTLNGSSVANFNPDTEEYTVTLASSVKNVVVSGEANDSNASVNGFKSYPVSTTGSAITITVTAANSQTKEYIINVSRDADNDTKLANLTILVAGHTISPAFNPTTKTYEVVLPYNYTKFKSTDLAYTKAYSEQVVTLDNDININPDNTVQYKINVVAEDQSTSDDYILNVKRAKSTINTLESLTVTNNNGVIASITPSFEPTKYTYTFTVPVDTTHITINGVKTDINSEVNGFDTDIAFTTDTGKTITVTSETGAEQTYTLNIVKLKSTDATLKSLTANIGTWDNAFASDKAYYELTVPYGTTQVTLTAEKNYPLAKSVTGAGVVNIADSPITITVTAEDETVTKDYTVVIKTASNTDATLSDIMIDNISIDNFSPSTDEYYVNVDSKDKTIVVSGDLTDSNASADGFKSYDLPVGEKEIIITVTAEDGTTTKTYKLYVTRPADEDATLESLTINVAGHTITPSFTPGQSTYEVTLPYTYTSFDSTDLTYKKAYDAQTVSFDSPISIDSDNFTEFKITVKAEDATKTKVYTLKVKRAKSTINTLESLSVTNDKGVLGSIAPSFKPDTNEYTISIPVDSAKISIAGEKTDVNSEVTGFEIDLPFSTDVEKTITVTSESGEPNYYKITIVKQKSSDANLKNLTADIGTFDKTFKSNVLYYELTVPYGTTKVNLAAEASYPYAQGVEGTGEVNVTDSPITITVTAEDGEATKGYTVKIIVAKNTVATLDDLTLDGNTVTNFDPTDEEYEITVGSKDKKITVNGTKTDENASVDGFKDYDLIVGRNTIYITVTSEDGKVTKTYTLYVTRPADEDTSLASLTVNVAGHTINPVSFNPQTRTYDVVLPYTHTTFSSGDVSFTKSYKEQTVLLDSFININPDTPTAYKINVISENPAVSEDYTLNVTRAKSPINTLESLTVLTDKGKMGAFVPSFKPDTNEYTVSVPVDTVSIDIAGTKTDINSEVDGFENYVIGTEETITITVQSETGVDNEYILNIVRAKSADATLSALTVTPGGLKQIFEPGTTYYTVTVPFAYDSVTVMGVPTHEGAIIESGAGSYSLGFTNRTVQVRVLAEDGETRKDYTIVITREKNDDSSLSSLKVNNTLVNGFDPEVLTYTLPDVENSITSINITATPNDTVYGSVTGTGNISLNPGVNNLEVYGVAHDGTTTKYRIIVKRLPNNNALLDMIKIDGAPLADFTPTQNYYEINVPNNKTSVEVTPEFSAGISQVDVSGNTNFVTDGNGNNFILIDVVADGGATNTYTIKVIRARSVDNTLSFLDVNPGALSPTFKSDRNNYNVNVGRDVDSVEFTYTKSYEDAKVVVTGPETLALGANTYLITVTPESGEINVYTVIVTREKDSDNLLKFINIDNELVDGFEENTTFYQIDVNTNITAVNVTAETKSARATYTIDGPSTLTVGLNPFTIKVKAENGSTKTYTLIINVTQSSNTNLKTLSVTPNDINETFNPAIKDYTVNVANTVNNVTITATPDDPNARYEISGPYQLSDGENIYTVKVIAEDNSSSTYKVKVIRAAKDEIEVALDSLSVAGYTLKEAFNKNLTTYHLNIADESVTSVVVNATAKTGLIVNVTGQNSLAPGTNTINIKVSSGTLEKNYKIIVTIGAEEISYIIESDIHTIDADYISTVKPEITSLNLKDELLNPNEYLYIYDKDGNEITSASSDYIGTGFVVKLIIEGTVYDEKTVVIKGDVDGTGTINSIDARGIILHVIEKVPLTGANFEAAYLAKPNGINTLTSINARSIILHVIGQDLLHT